MKHIKRLRLFENTQGLTKDQINFLDHYTDGEWEVNPNTGLVDVKGWFSCSERRLGSFKGVNFGGIFWSFYCSNNRLTSLEGAPQRVGGNFQCSNNSLTSLEGAPKEVGRGFDCSSNSITSLEGSPREVGEDFFCNNNSLTSLKGAPQKVGHHFDCRYNSLTSLEGAPEKVGRDFQCDEFELGKGEWNPQGWLKILREGSEESKKLILTLPYFEPENLQNEIKKNPGKWVMELKGVWNLEEFKPIRDQLKLSDRFIKDIGDQSGLSDLGF